MFFNQEFNEKYDAILKAVQDIRFCVGRLDLIDHLIDKNESIDSKALDTELCYLVTQALDDIKDATQEIREHLDFIDQEVEKSALYEGPFEDEDEDEEQ